MTATVGVNGAGIGSGSEGSCADISISGGNVTANGGEGSTGIGSGSNGSCGNISIGGQARGSAHGGQNCRLDIGAGESGTCGQVVFEV